MNSKSLPALTYCVYNFWIDPLHYPGLEFGGKTGTQSLAYPFPSFDPFGWLHGNLPFHRKEPTPLGTL